MCSALHLFKTGNFWKKQWLEMFTKKSVLKSFAKLTGKYLCWSRSETLLRKRIWHRYFPVEHFLAPALSLLLESPIFWGFLSSNLPDVYLWVFWLTLHMLLFHLSSINDTQIVLTLTKFALYVCWLNMLPPSFLFRINELMQEGEKNWRRQWMFYPWFREGH